MNGEQVLGNNIITQAAKELRQRQTEAEKLLWLKLKAKHLKGFKFRRQEPIGTYIVDFVSFEKKLIVEVDGSLHQETEIKINDIQRSAWLKEQGFKVLRFWNSDVTNNIGVVLEKITRETIR